MIHTAHLCHHINTQACDFGRLATKMNRMTFAQILQFKSRNRDDISSESRQGRPQSREICWARDKRKIDIPAKLGRAVQHASLPAHQQGANSVLFDRRKDFVYRVRDQASPLAKGTLPRAWPIPANAPSVSGSTTLPIPHRLVLQPKSFSWANSWNRSERPPA